MNAPFLHEINTRCWLRELGNAAGRPVGLGDVPDETITNWRKLGFSHVWLMGVWRTDAGSRRQALNDPGLRPRLDDALPDWEPEDVGGSPYAVGDYDVPAELGGNEGLANLRTRLHEAGMRLILDFVPNHTGLSHSWLEFWPHLYVPGTPGADGSFLHHGRNGDHWIAHGKDPHFPAWRDTAQLDYRRSETHKAVLDTLQLVADKCDGVRCDMAMLMLRDVFGQTWSTAPCTAEISDQQFWSHAIPTVKERHPDFIFLAEVYWDLERDLQQLGFDFTYDKWLYDHLRNGNGAEARKQLRAVDREFLARSVHFLENHDEPRAARVFSREEYRAALVLLCGLPGMRLLHDGQLEGRRVDLPVQLSRRRTEPVDEEIRSYLAWLLRVIPTTSIGAGEWKMLSSFPAWSTNKTHDNIVVMQWSGAGEHFELVVVNLSADESQCFAHPEIAGLAAKDWRMTDLLGEQDFVREGRDMVNRGLYLALDPHAAHIFHFLPNAAAHAAQSPA